MSAARSSTETGTTAIAEAPPRYRGRFAPSPTGPLHFGSLVAALGSCLAARAQHGEWFVRIENIDRTREIPGAADLILRTLETYGFQWDGPIVYQSERTTAYAAALEQLHTGGWLFGCSCSRSEIEALTPATTPPAEELRYPGTCRHGPRHPGQPLALRFRVPAGVVAFEDAIQGPVAVDVGADCGDFVVRRKDGFFAYQLAVVVDDRDLGITQVVRGADLLDSTPRQILLHRALQLPVPGYAHLPLAVDPSGKKLSKSTQSLPVDSRQPVPVLWQALKFLKQAPPADLEDSSIGEIWDWAVAHWSFTPLLGQRTLPAPPP